MKIKNEFKKKLEHALKVIRVLDDVPIYSYPQELSKRRLIARLRVVERNITGIEFRLKIYKTIDVKDLRKHIWGKIKECQKNYRVKILETKENRIRAYHSCFWYEIAQEKKILKELKSKLKGGRETKSNKKESRDIYRKIFIEDNGYFISLGYHKIDMKTNAVKILKRAGKEVLDHKGYPIFVNRCEAPRQEIKRRLRELKANDSFLYETYKKRLTKAVNLIFRKVYSTDTPIKQMPEIYRKGRPSFKEIL